MCSDQKRPMKEKVSSWKKEMKKVQHQQTNTDSVDRSLSRSVRMNPPLPSPLDFFILQTGVSYEAESNMPPSDLEIEKLKLPRQIVLAFVKPKIVSPKGAFLLRLWFSKILVPTLRIFLFSLLFFFFFFFFLIFWPYYKVTDWVQCTREVKLGLLVVHSLYV